MTKEERIKSEWDKFGISENIDVDGWADMYVVAGINTLSDRFHYKEYSEHSNNFETILCRPKSISGIENNNGWIKIESEEDLPKQDIRCEFIKDNGKQLYGRFENRMGGLFIDESRRFESPEYRTESVTHYQPIEKLPSPLH